MRTDPDGLPGVGSSAEFDHRQTILSIFLCLLLALVLQSCTTTPIIPKDARASWDGGAQNSGLIAGLGQGYFIVTPHWHDRYVALAARHGNMFSPPVTNDFGVMPYTNGTFYIDGQRAVQFIRMNRAEKAIPSLNK